MQTNGVGCKIQISIHPDFQQSGKKFVDSACASYVSKRRDGSDALSSQPAPCKAGQPACRGGRVPLELRYTIPAAAAA